MKLAPHTERWPLKARLCAALREDHGRAGDLTSRALIPPGAEAEAVVVAKAAGVVCGIGILKLVFELAAEMLGTSGHARPARRAVLHIRCLKKDGATVRPGDEVARLRGLARVLLFAERTALNFLCRLSGIATLAARYVAAVKGTRAAVFDTRKTVPLWRDLEKYAVRCGGARNHRLGLHDMVLIKDNHLAFWGAGDPDGAVRATQTLFPGLRVEVEVTDLAALERVCRGSSPDFVLLDNFAPADVRKAVRLCRGLCGGRAKRPALEASGGITLRNVRAFAAAGADRISVGALTHSARALDFSLEFLASRQACAPVRPSHSDVRAAVGACRATRKGRNFG